MTKAQREKFLEAMRSTGNASVSARAASVARSTVYRLRGRDPEFAAAWDDAREEAIDALYMAQYRDALAGTDPQGRRWLLARMRPEEFGNQRARGPARPLSERLRDGNRSRRSG